MELYKTLEELSDKVKVGYPMEDYKSNVWVTLGYIEVKHEKTANKPQV